MDTASDAEKKGVVELLWETFGGTENEEGYKVLDSHVGCIYGDSITRDRAENICSRLAHKGFATTNWVAGIGSYTYQYNTRDTFGFAMKATYCEVNGQGRNIYKDPITDDGTKKSAKGLLCVSGESTEYKLIDEVNQNTEQTGELVQIFKDGVFSNKEDITTIRQRLLSHLDKKELVL